MFPVKNKTSISERKKALRAEADFYKTTIDGQVMQLKSDAVAVSTKALFIAATLLGTYLLFNFIVSDDEKEQEAKIVLENTNVPMVIKPSEENSSWLVKSIKGYMLSFLMGIARNKIMAAIAMLKDSNAK